MPDNGSQNDRVTSGRVSTGVPDLDDILGGGLPQGELYLIKGGPGTGKTTLGLEFLLEGATSGERVLYLSLAQTEDALARIAQGHGWSLSDVEVRGFRSDDLAGGGSAEQTLFYTSEVELGETTQRIREVIESTDPERVVFDSMNVIGMLAGNAVRYWQEILSLRQFLNDKQCTVLFLEGDPGDDGQGSLETLAHGLIHLEQTTPEYGALRRRLQVVKVRGAPFHSGFHNFRIRRGGIDVYPRLAPMDSREDADWAIVESGVPELDGLLGGGLAEGTACALLGPTGTGKSTIASLYAHRVARAGDHAAIFLFDERAQTFYRRSRGLGMDIEPLVEDGRITLEQVETGAVSPGEFAARIRNLVEERDCKVVILDSLTGYFNAMSENRHLTTQMHDLLLYLSQHGVLSFLVVGQHGILGSDVHGEVDISYLADVVLLLRHFEAEGRLRKAISVVKKRFGEHEAGIRELLMTPEGVLVGEPLPSFSGVLAGSPSYLGDAQELMDSSVGNDPD